MKGYHLSNHKNKLHGQIKRHFTKVKCLFFCASIARKNKLGRCAKLYSYVEDFEFDGGVVVV